MFKNILQDIVEQSGGGISSAVMGYDGIAIDQYEKPCEGIDLQLIAVEYANVLKEVKRTVEILETGDMEEVAIRTERFTVLIRALTDEYFVTLTLGRNGNFGKARYMLAKESFRLREALA
ncbi:GTPase-activating protein, putative [Syntrophotalea carbinolica DSM 2380]|uniref:GTPase-activating protein, putative n=1 Tax=Syntrophotalea carbinolica (strain DSM 2380 / NBRC 103641 / GraBd1) TaxID=338963 RepID=Q3A2N8_SYNC1|nr:GTPase [Syntrophotalea carbinolica]ABA89369.1 GTPase-activating protein, putative [Syntrophotalea carbinolica DSM 2380]